MTQIQNIWREKHQPIMSAIKPADQSVCDFSLLSGATLGYTENRIRHGS